MIEPSELVKIILARGPLVSRLGGIIGLVAFVSTHMKSGKPAAKVQSDIMTNQCDHGSVLPPTF